MSKDLDVHVWLQYRLFHGKSALTDIGDFVIIDPNLHDEFDAFKKAEIAKGHSFVPINELLLLFCLPQFSDLHELPRIEKFGERYLYLTAAQIDQLILWVYEMRENYSASESTFHNAVESLWQANVTGLLHYYYYKLLLLLLVYCVSRI